MKTLMLLFLLFATSFLSVEAQTLFQLRPVALPVENSNELSKLIRDYRVVSLTPKSVADICAKGNCSFQLETPDRVWNITLEENNLLGPNYRMAVNGKSRIQQGPTVKTYKGFIGDNPDNYVRLTIGKNFLDGYLKIDSTLLFIKPVKLYLQNFYFVKKSLNLNLGIFGRIFFNELRNILNIIQSLVCPVYSNHFLSFSLACSVV